MFVNEEFDTLPEAPIQYGQVEQWRKNNRTLQFQFSPISNDGLACISPSDLTKNDIPILPQEGKIYPTSIPGLTYTPEYRTFVLQTSSALQIVLNFNFVNSTENIRDGRWDSEIPMFIGNFVELIHPYTASNHRLADVNNIVRCFHALRFQLDSKNNIAAAFSQWVNNADIDQSAEQLPELLNNHNPLNSLQFWQCIYTLAIRNMTSLCADALEAALPKTSEQDLVQHFVQCLREYPVDADVFTFKAWQNLVKTGSNKVQQVSDNSLRIYFQSFLSILQGSRTEILSKSNSWIEAMSGLFCYSDPTRKHLDDYYMLAVEQFPVDETLAWESGCAAVIRGDFLAAIEKIESLDPFVAAVVCETCEAKGLMDVYLPEAFSDIREWLRINFAKLCLDDKDLAPVGVQLLQLIGSDEARAIFAEYVPRMVLISPDDIAFALSVAKDFNLPGTVRAIHRATAKRLEAQGAYLEAFINLDSIQDVEGLRTLAWKMFEECLLLGEPLGGLVLEDLVNDTLDYEISDVVKDTLAPYVVLAKSQEYLRSGKSRQAAQHLAALVRFSHIPVKYLGLLFLLVEHLLDRSQPRVFDLRELIDLMRAVDKWEEGISKDATVRQESKQLYMFSLDPVEDKSTATTIDPDLMTCLKSIRGKLTREVSRAYMENPQ